MTPNAFFIDIHHPQKQLLQVDLATTNKCKMKTNMLVRSLLFAISLLFGSEINAFAPTSSRRIRSRGISAKARHSSLLHALDSKTSTIDSPKTSSSPSLAEEPSSEEPSFSLDDIASKNTENLLGGLAWRGVVAVLCALWASNFAAAKLIIAEPGVDSSLYAVARFTTAALALAPFAVSSARKNGIDFETIKSAAICGGWVAFGYLGQTLGLLTTTASRSCVICSLHCVFVAVIAELMRTSRSASASFDTKRLAPAALAVLGVAIVELQGAGGAPTIGDALSFAQPIGFGMGYLQLEELMRKRPETALPVSAIKLVVVALASLGMFELTPLFADNVGTVLPSLPDFGAILSSPVAMGGILYTGIVTTALALWVESIAFAKVPATDASIILTTEPLFAALFGAVSLGETFGMSDYAGASLIVGACVLAALLDVPGDETCIVEEDPACEEPRKWPFWGF